MSVQWQSRACPNCINYLWNVYTTGGGDSPAYVSIVCTNCGYEEHALLGSFFSPVEAETK